MSRYAALMRRVARDRWRRWLAMTAGFFVLYHAGLLVLTVARFHEFPNYVELYDVIGSYRQILHGTPAWSDALRIILDEPQFETGFKDPHYYGVATWSYLLIPPKMAIVSCAGALLATVMALSGKSASPSAPRGAGRPWRSPARARYWSG